MNNNQQDVFISYRRAGGNILARLIYEILKQKRYSVFFDYESLSSGVFGAKIIETIRGVKDVIVVLSKNCLERCKDENDWMYCEISEAIRTDRNIILVFSEDFEMPSQEELAEYPREIQELLKYQGYLVNIEHFDNIIKKICQQMRSAPYSVGEAEIEPVISFILGDGADKLSAEQKNSLINRLLRCSYDKPIADIVSSFVKSAPANYKNIRPHFRYEIEIDNRFSFYKLGQKEDEYFTLSETLSYRKLFLDDAVENSFWISFVRNLDKLDGSLRDESFLFSENLLINEEDLQTLVTLSDDEKRDFYCKSMRVRVNINGKVLSPKEILITDAGIFASYENEISASENANILDVKIAFSIPHRKTACYFFASISDPTYSPYVHFSYPEDEIDVDMIPFMNRETTSANAKIFDGLRELSFENEWVLPMSGAVFIIAPQGESDF